MKENGGSSSLPDSRPGEKLSYCETVSANPLPALTITLPENPASDPSATAARIPSNAKWNSRLPVSRA